MAELERAWTELDADPAVRVIVNAGNGPAFQTGLDVAQLSRDPAALREQSHRTKRAELRLTAWHNQVWKPVIAAINGVCRRWPPLRGRRRHRDRGERRHVPRPPRVRRPGDGLRGDRARAEVARQSRSSGWRSPAATSASTPCGPASSASSARWSTRPSGCGRGHRSWPTPWRGTRRRPWRPPSGRCGARFGTASPTPARRGRGPGVDVGPP